MTNKYHLSSVGKALEVLMFLAEYGEVGVTEIASNVDCSKATVFRLLYTLKSKGFVYQNKETNKYRLGYRIFAIGMKVKGQDLLGEQITPFIKRLSAKSGETVNVGVLEGSEVVHVNSIVSDQHLRLDIKIGDRESVHSTALGKILLAYKNWNDARAILEKIELQKFTPTTITDLSGMKDELETVRKRGYALDNEESYRGIRCIAVPLYEGKGHLVAALSLSAPASRFDDEKVSVYHQLLVETACEIQAFLGKNLLNENWDGVR